MHMKSSWKLIIHSTKIICTFITQASILKNEIKGQNYRFLLGFLGVQFMFIICTHKAHLHWQKPKSKKPGVFCCTVYTARKTHNIWGFWHEKRMREKTWISYLCFGKWCACATSLYLWPYTCSAHYVAGRGRVIPLKVTYTTWPKTRIIPARLERAFTLAKNQ